MLTQLDFPNPNGQPTKMNLDFRMSGGGASALNLNRGMVKSGDSVTRIEGKISPVEKDSPTPTITLKGTIKITIAGGN